MALCLTVLAALLLAACGSSTHANSTGTTGRAAARDPITPELHASQACLHAHGITTAHGSTRAPKGMSHARYRALLEHCTATARTAGARPVKIAPSYRHALGAFAACMRTQGVPMAAPNTSGKGPVFRAKGLDVTGPRFRHADAACRAILRRASPPGGGTR